MTSKKLICVMLAIIIVLGLTAVSCATRPYESLLNGIHPALSNMNGVSEKTGTAVSTVYLGFFGETSFPSISEAAKNGGITKIATVEYYYKWVFLFFIVDYITIVTGE